MSACSVCNKKIGLLKKKAGAEGKCWSCQRVACARCAPMFDGSLLGWVRPHPCCAKCTAALQRQERKLASHMAAAAAPPPPPSSAQRTLEALPAWELPADGRPGPRVGGARDDARRASRVLLKALVENYGARASFGTPGPGRAGDESEEEEFSSQQEEDDDDDEAVVLVDEAEGEAVVPPAGAGRPAKLKVADQETRRRRLSMGVLANLEDLNRAAAAMDKSYAAPADADEAFLASLADQGEEQSAKDAASSKEQESQTEQPAVAAPAATPADAVADDDDNDDDGATAVGFELGEEAGQSDAELMTALDSLDHAVPEATRKAVEADPLASVADALSAVASRPSNPEASAAMHEDVLEALAEVKREQRDAKMVAMLDAVEARLKDSLVVASTPPVRRKVQGAPSKFTVGASVSARNAADNSWYPARVERADGDEYCITFLASKKSQDVREKDLRGHIVGGRVLAPYKEDGLGMLQAGIIDYITPEGKFSVCFDSDRSHNIVSEADLKPEPANAAAAQQPAAAPAVDSPVVRRTNNPMALSSRDSAIRAAQFVQSWLRDSKRQALTCKLDSPMDRRTLLVLAQLVQHLRKMFEMPANEIGPFELRTPQANAGGETALYARLQKNTISGADFMLDKFRQLETLVSHPKAEGEKLETVVSKITRIRDWVRGTSEYLETI